MGSLRNAFGFFLIVSPLVGCTPKSAPAPKPEVRAEIQWGQKIGEEFLESISLREDVQQKMLTTEAFKKSQSSTNGLFLLNPNLHLKKWTVTEKDCSPEGHEVTLKGTLELKSRERILGELEFVDRTGTWFLTVVKEKDSENWRVNYCRLSVALDK